MMDVVRYEQALKQRFVSVISIPKSPAQSIIDELSGPLPEVFERQTKVCCAFVCVVCGCFVFVCLFGFCGVICSLLL
jgi:hypothetical protein